MRTCAYLIHTGQVPLTVSGNIMYKVVNPKRASIDIEGGDVDPFVRNQAMIAMKQSVGQFRYGPVLSNCSVLVGDTASAGRFQRRYTFNHLN